VTWFFATTRKWGCGRSPSYSGGYGRSKSGAPVAVGDHRPAPEFTDDNTVPVSTSPLPTLARIDGIDVQNGPSASGPVGVHAAAGREAILTPRIYSSATRSNNGLPVAYADAERREAVARRVRERRELRVNAEPPAADAQEAAR